MKPFEETIKSAAVRVPVAATPEGCAALLLETTPRVMRAVRMAIADLDAPALTIPQFRTLQFVAMHSGASLSATAEFLGLTLPSTSKLVDQLVRRTMLRRDDAQDDRRRMMLRITDRGDALLKNAQEAVCVHLTGLLNQLGRTELVSLHNTLLLLREHFPSPATMGVEEHLGGNGDRHRGCDPGEAGVMRGIDGHYEPHSGEEVV
jgi:DNA-binding MarR family transcriptional regulator